MIFGIRFYQYNDTSLKEQLSRRSNIKVETFDCPDDVLNSTAVGALESPFVQELSELNKTMLQERANAPNGNDLKVLAGRTEFEVKPPSIHDMKGETIKDKYDTLINFISKLNSKLQYGLAELIASNNATIKTDKGESITHCGAIVDIVYTLDKDTVDHIKAIIKPTSGNSITDIAILNDLVRQVHKNISQDNSDMVKAKT